MLGTANRAYAGSAAAVRHAECLVQVQVAYIGPDITGIRKSDLSIHVGTVHIHLTAGIVDRIHYFAYTAFEHADNVIANAPHTAVEIAGEWNHPYSRMQAAFPLPQDTSV